MDWKFETYVEKIKFDVLREVARASYAGNFRDIESKLPEILVPGRKANYRCCVYMERAIMSERIKITRGGEWDDFNIIDVIPIACDQCPMGGYTVTESCRGCIGHACRQACPKNAITVDGLHRAHIDKEKCVNCGLCAKACPFGAIYNFRRPCQKACPTSAITMDENLSAKIDYSKCIVCGLCTQKCPFGAIASKTFITFVIDHIRNNILSTKKRPIFAMIAPSIAAQFPGVNLNQIIDAIMKLGFTNVVEVALGADVVAQNEARELVEKKILTSSCCPAFVSYIEKFHPELKDRISNTPSPMAEIGKIIKTKYPDALTVFIGPCTAKKDERCKPNVRPYVDYVLTFVELRAMFTAREIEIEKLEGISLDEASPFGRGFGRIGGVSDAVIEALKEVDIKDFKLSAVACSGMRECIRALESLSNGNSRYNFIEGMACEGGCVCGPESLNHNVAVGKSFVQSHARQAKNKTLNDSTVSYGIKKAESKAKPQQAPQQPASAKTPVTSSIPKKPAVPAAPTKTTTPTKQFTNISTKYPGAKNSSVIEPFSPKRSTVAMEQLKAKPTNSPISEAVTSSARKFTPKIDMSKYPGAKNAVFIQPYEPPKLVRRSDQPTNLRRETIEPETPTTPSTTAPAPTKTAPPTTTKTTTTETKPTEPPKNETTIKDMPNASVEVSSPEKENKKEVEQLEKQTDGQHEVTVATITKEDKKNQDNNK